MGSAKKTDQKPHAVCIPFPLQGHVNPMHKLAKLLHHKGFHITFVNTEYIQKRILKSTGPDSVKELPDFQFKTIPDGLQSNDIDCSQDFLSLVDSTRKNCFIPFRNLLAKLNESSPPVTCIVSDGSMSFSVQAAQELGIPTALFWTPSASGFMCYLHYKDFIHKGLIPLKDESYLTNGYLETPIDWIPGMKDIRLKDIATFVRTTDPNDLMMDFVIGETDRTYKASAIILNTFDAFENDVLDGMKIQMSLPPIYTIGPLQLLINQIPKENPVQSLGSNLWKEEPECLQWLDSKKPNSVVYVNFGSITVMTNQQLIEFAWGLANSKKTFLWVVRPDLVKGDKAVLPPEERSFIASWCPQEQVLHHPSIAGFLTHCGWNSTLDTVCGGVPVICWPFFAEQQTNCRYACRDWGIGMEIDNNVKRDEVESLVRELMECEKGKKMKNRALEWKKKAEEASVPGGSSYVNLDKLIKEILVTKHHNQ